jgi:hypothetical protein
MDTFRPISPKSGEFSASTLQGIEKGFRTIQVDVEEQVPV